MSSKYLETTKIFIFFLRRRKSKYQPASGAVVKFVWMNYKTRREPLAFSMRMFVFASLFSKIVPHDQSYVDDLMFFLDSLIEIVDHSVFKFTF